MEGHPSTPPAQTPVLISLVSASFQVVELQNLPLNGLQCYSCEGNSTHGCSSEEASLTACRGPMSQCLEATGSNGEPLEEAGKGELWVGGCGLEVALTEMGLPVEKVGLPLGGCKVQSGIRASIRKMGVSATEMWASLGAGLPQVGGTSYGHHGLPSCAIQDQSLYSSGSPRFSSQNSLILLKPIACVHDLYRYLRHWK